MKNLFARFIKEEEGQDLIEYALLAALIAVAALHHDQTGSIGDSSATSTRAGFAS